MIKFILYPFTFLLLLTSVFGAELSLQKLIEDYAQVKKLRIIYTEEDLLKKNSLLESNFPWKEASTETKREFLLKMLNTFNRSLEENDDSLTVFPARDIRFRSIPQYDSKDFPLTNGYIQVSHRLKFPMAREIMRSIRPVVTRYGRVVTFADNQTMVFMEQGKNIRQILEIIHNADDKNNYDLLMKKKKERKKREARPVKKEEQKNSQENKGEKHV